SEPPSVPGHAKLVLVSLSLLDGCLKFGAGLGFIAGSLIPGGASFAGPEDDFGLTGRGSDVKGFVSGSESLGEATGAVQIEKGKASEGAGKRGTAGCPLMDDDLLESGLGLGRFSGLAIEVRKRGELLILSGLPAQLGVEIGGLVIILHGLVYLLGLG